MKWRKCLAFLVPLLGLVSIIRAERFFPFSNYYMFSNAKRDLTAYRIVVQKKDGSEVPLTGKQTYPFNRLHINHMIFNTKPNLQWTDFFLQRLQKESPDYVGLTVQMVLFEYDPNSPQLKPAKIQTLYRNPK